MTQTLALEWAQYNINVNCIAPGSTLSGRFKASIENRSKEDMKKISDTGKSILTKPALPEHISSVVHFLLSEESCYISGQIIRVDGGQFTSPI